MAKYETVISVNGVRVKVKHHVTGIFDDVAKLCINRKLTVLNITPHKS